MSWIDNFGAVNTKYLKFINMEKQDFFDEFAYYIHKSLPTYLANLTYVATNVKRVWLYVARRLLKVGRHKTLWKIPHRDMSRYSHKLVMSSFATLRRKSCIAINGFMSSTFGVKWPPSNLTTI